ncbi:MAG: DNA ligase-associated DEXH box helicase, partial [Verrucomicrobiota bacterium]
MVSSSRSNPLVSPTENGLFCELGGFYIDPWRRVERALVTHGHSDHARSGMGSYLTAEPGMGVVRERVGADARIEGIPFGQSKTIGQVKVSFHPAGHLLGSAQIRLEHQGEVWVVTGDYKTDEDLSCEAFEPVKCHTLITESTFGLPIYNWPEPREVFQQINEWWQENQAEGRTSVLFAYALGKAQRVLCGIDPSIGP